MCSTSTCSVATRAPWKPARTPPSSRTHVPPSITVSRRSSDRALSRYIDWLFLVHGARGQGILAGVRYPCWSGPLDRITGQPIVVTGGTGSFGQQFVRRILDF